MTICNTMAIGRPGKEGMSSLQCNTSGCSGLGHTDPVYKKEMSPRRNREKVREQIKDYILHMLGAPKISIELDEQNLDFCVDQALMIFEDYAGREYYSYYTFNTIPGKSVYELPADIGLVRNVFYKEQGSFSFQTNDLDGSLPISYFNGAGSSSMWGGSMDPTQPIYGKMGEWALYKQYEQTFSRLAGNIGGWEFVGGMRNIKVYPIPFNNKLVIVHYLQRQKDFQQVTQAMQEGALTYAKEILGRIRSRFANLPGPGGGVQLDGPTLIQEAREDRQKWFEDLLNKFGEFPYISMD